jgi:mannose-6-phosphate isomerase-like protein (cupin superfamily)
MEFFEVVRLLPGETLAFGRIGKKEKLIVSEGECQIAFGNRVIAAKSGTNLDLQTPEESFQVIKTFSDATLVRMCGRWGDETGGSGLFTVIKSDKPQDRGDAVDYPKETTFDSHYHDCDEYWILFEGGGIAVSEGRAYEVGPGDCVATGMGHHHDFPKVHAPVKAVYFETTLEGRKRRGHLWNHTHGPAQPKAERS